MPDIWSWLQHYQVSLLHSGTPAHREMLQLYERATFFGGAGALSLLREARRRAAELGETCFSLFLAHWITENLLWHTRDYRAALENALGAVLLIRQQPGCPLEDRLHINLIEVYTEIDPGGYRREIADNLAYVEANVDLDYESHCMMAFRRGLMHARLGEGAAAQAAANACLATVEKAGGADYYRAVAHFVLGVVAFQAGDAEALLKIATTGAAETRSGSPHVYLPEFLMWQAVALRRLGNAAAEPRRHDAVAAGQRDPGALCFAYYNALAAWFTDQGRIKDAIQVREAQRQVIAGHGRALDWVELWLDVVALHRQAGLPTDAPAQATREAAAKMGQPQLYLDRLAALLDG